MPLNKPFAEEEVTVLSTVTALTASTYNQTSNGAASNREYPTPSTTRAQGAVVEVKTESIYYTLNGGTPTSADHQLNTGDTVTLNNHQQVANFRAIRTGGTNATLSVTYYKE